MNSSTAIPAGPKPWMRYTLLAAGLYNLLWGTWVVFFPEQVFVLTGADPLPVYPQIWQCVGMMVAVFGVGYLIAARHPFVHWPMVFVGLLGKILGPIGFAVALREAALPAEFGWTILTNDVIWWLPFAAILWSAAKFHQCVKERLVVSRTESSIAPLSRMHSQRGATLLELSRRQPLLVVFLRHSGCTFCREAVADIAVQRAAIEALGTQIAFVHMGQNEPAELMEKHGLTDIHRFRDPLCTLYDAFGLGVGTFGQVLGLKVWWRGLLSCLQGHRAGKFDGNVFRMPGVFLLYRGEVVRAYRHQSAADRPDYVALASLPSDAAPKADSTTNPQRVKTAEVGSKPPQSG